MADPAVAVWRPSFNPGLGLLALFFLLLGPPAALGEGAGMAGEHAHHHHHPVPEGSARSLTTYLIPAVNLVDQHGQQRSIQDVLDTDKPVLLNFIFTSCTAICPMMSATFQQVQRQLGEDAGKVDMVSVSIDPEQDTPATLADYAKRFHAGPQWTFLTGTLADSVTVQKAFDAYRGDKMNHAPLTLLRATPGDQWVRYDGFVKAGDLVNEVRGILANGHQEAQDDDKG